MLGPRRDNGGLTETFGLTAGSPAIDAVPAADCSDTGGTPITADQRDRPRPTGTACDIGAFEFSDPGIAVSPAVVYQGVDFDSTVTLTFMVSSTGLLPLDWDVTEDPPVGWLTATPTSSTVPTSTKESLDVTLDTTGIAAGRYETTLQFDHNAPRPLSGSMSCSACLSHAAPPIVHGRCSAMTRATRGGARIGDPTP